MDLTRLVDHAGFGQDADQRADRIEQVDEEEREYGNQHVQAQEVVEVELEHDRGRRGRYAEKPFPLGNSKRDTNERGRQDAQQQSARHFPDQQDSRQEQADERKHDLWTGHVAK